MLPHSPFAPIATPATHQAPTQAPTWSSPSPNLTLGYLMNPDWPQPSAPFPPCSGKIIISQNLDGSGQSQKETLGLQSSIAVLESSLFIDVNVEELSPHLAKLRECREVW